MNHSLVKIVCGFQDGADIAGARAAVACGLPTQGWMPPDFMTSSGSHPEYADLYGAKALDPGPFRNLFGVIDEGGWKLAYRQRTILNVQMSHGVVWLGNPWSPGGRLTLNTAQEASISQYVMVNSTYRGGDGEPTLEDWIRRQILEDEAEPVLMVAGNRESRNRGIEQWVEAYLTTVFRNLAGRRSTES